MKPLIENNNGLGKDYATTSPIWEELHPKTRYTEMTGVRLYEDGLFFRWSNKRRILKDGLIPATLKADYAWRAEVKISSLGMKRIKDLLQNSFRNIPEGKPVTKEYILLQANYDEKSHQVNSENERSTPEPYRFYTELNNLIGLYTVPQGVPFEQKE